jgi:CRISPR-associated endonuclease Cas2
MLLVAYDIPDDRRRLEVMKALQRMGRRVQYSVFVVERESAARVEGVLRPLIVPMDDDVRIHVICRACEAAAVLLGRAHRGAKVGFRVI